MPKILIRIVALFLVPCLAGDALVPACAATFGKQEAALIADPGMASVLQEQALSGAMLDALHVLIRHRPFIGHLIFSGSRFIDAFDPKESVPPAAAPDRLPKTNTYVIKIHRSAGEEPVHALMQLSRTDATEAQLRLYSSLKMGVPEVVSEFSRQFAEVLPGFLGLSSDRENWMIASIGGQSASALVAIELSKRLSIPYMILKLTPKPGINYATLRTTEERVLGGGALTVRGKDQSRIAGRKIVLIDDSMVTGSAIIRAEKLLAQYDAARMVPFVVAYIDGQEDASYENIVNHANADLWSPGYLSGLLGRSRGLLLPRLVYRILDLKPNDMTYLLNVSSNESLLNLYFYSLLYLGFYGNGTPPNLERIRETLHVRQDLALPSAFQFPENALLDGLRDDVLQVLERYQNYIPLEKASEATVLLDRALLKISSKASDFQTSAAVSTNEPAAPAAPKPARSLVDSLATLTISPWGSKWGDQPVSNPTIGSESADREIVFHSKGAVDFQLLGNAKVEILAPKKEMDYFDQRIFLFMNKLWSSLGLSVGDQTSVKGMVIEIVGNAAPQKKDKVSIAVDLYTLRNNQRVLRVVVDQAKLLDSSWQKIKVNWEGYKNVGMAYFNTNGPRDLSAYTLGGGGFRAFKNLNQNLPAELRYLKLQNGLRTELNVLLPDALADEPGVPFSMNDLTRLVHAIVPGLFNDILYIPNLPFHLHLEGPKHGNHLVELFRAWATLENDISIPERYRNLLSDPEEKSFFTLFILLHDLGKLFVKPKMVGEEGHAYEVYAGHEQESFRLATANPALRDLVAKSPNPRALLEAIHWHGALYEAGREPMSAEQFEAFIHEHQILLDQMEDIIPRLIACCLIDLYGTRPKDVRRQPPFNFIEGYEAYRKAYPVPLAAAPKSEVSIEDVQAFVQQINPAIQEELAARSFPHYPEVCPTSALIGGILLHDRFGDSLRISKTEGRKQNTSHTWLEIDLSGRRYFLSFSEGQFDMDASDRRLREDRYEEFLQAYRQRGLDRAQLIEMVGGQEEFYRQQGLTDVHDKPFAFDSRPDVVDHIYHRLGWEPPAAAAPENIGGRPSPELKPGRAKHFFANGFHLPGGLDDFSSQRKYKRYRTGSPGKDNLSASASNVHIMIFSPIDRKNNLDARVLASIPNKLRTRVRVSHVQFDAGDDDWLQIKGGASLDYVDDAAPPSELFDEVGEPDFIIFSSPQARAYAKEKGWQIFSRAVLLDAKHLDLSKLPIYLQLHAVLNAHRRKLTEPDQRLGEMTWHANAMQNLVELLLLNLQEAGNRSDLAARLQSIEREVWPLLHQVQPEFVKTYPTATDWLAFALMHDTNEFYITHKIDPVAEKLFQDLVRQAIRVAPNETIAHLFAAFGPHVRLFTGDSSDLVLAPSLLAHLIRAYSALESRNDAAGKELAKRYAMAIVNGLIINPSNAGHLEGYREQIDAWNQKLKRSQIDLRGTLHSIFTRYASSLPASPPYFLTFVSHVTGDRMGDALSEMNAARKDAVTSWDVLTGVAPNDLLRTLQENSGADGDHHAMMAKPKYTWLRNWALTAKSGRAAAPAGPGALGLNGWRNVIPHFVVGERIFLQGAGLQRIGEILVGSLEDCLQFGPLNPLLRAASAQTLTSQFLEWLEGEGGVASGYLIGYLFRFTARKTSKQISMKDQSQVWQTLRAALFNLGAVAQRMRIEETRKEGPGSVLAVEFLLRGQRIALDFELHDHLDVMGLDPEVKGLNFPINRNHFAILIQNLPQEILISTIKHETLEALARAAGYSIDDAHAFAMANQDLPPDNLAKLIKTLKSVETAPFGLGSAHESDEPAPPAAQGFVDELLSLKALVAVAKERQFPFSRYSLSQGSEKVWLSRIRGDMPPISIIRARGKLTVLLPAGPSRLNVAFSPETVQIQSSNPKAAAVDLPVQAALRDFVFDEKGSFYMVVSNEAFAAWPPAFKEPLERWIISETQMQTLPGVISVLSRSSAYPKAQIPQRSADKPRTPRAKREQRMFSEPMKRRIINRIRASVPIKTIARSLEVNEDVIRQLWKEYEKELASAQGPAIEDSSLEAHAVVRGEEEGRSQKVGVAIHFHITLNILRGFNLKSLRQKWEATGKTLRGALLGLIEQQGWSESIFFAESGELNPSLRISLPRESRECGLDEPCKKGYRYDIEFRPATPHSLSTTRADAVATFGALVFGFYALAKTPFIDSLLHVLHLPTTSAGIVLLGVAVMLSGIVAGYGLYGLVSLVKVPRFIFRMGRNVGDVLPNPLMAPTPRTVRSA